MTSRHPQQQHTTTAARVFQPPQAFPSLYSPKFQPYLTPTTSPDFYYDPRTGKFVPAIRPRPDLILDHLYLGDQKDAFSKQTLEAYNITHVITVTIVNDFQQYQKNLLPSIKFFVVPVTDEGTQDIKKYFKLTNEFIDEGRQKGNVLVHCVWGMSRSATIAIAYVMHHVGLKFREALRLVQKARPIVAPNMGFCQQLIDFEHNLSLVEMSMHFNTRYGQIVHVVGSHPQLGQWQCTGSNRMNWQGNGLWSVSLPVLGEQFEYKYVVRDETTGNILWESCNNRVYEGSRRFVRDHWNQSLPSIPSLVPLPLRGSAVVTSN